MTGRKLMKYSFITVDRCNMCHSDTASHKLTGKRLNNHQGLRPRKKGGISVSVYRCPACGLVYSNPMPVPENIQDHYGVPPESYWNDQSFVVPGGFFNRELDELEGLMGSLKNKKALDVGTGLGIGMIPMQERGMDVYGIEASVPFYERAIEKMNIPKEKLQCVTIEEAEFEKESFDFVNFGAVLEHFYDPSACILRGMNWLKPGGYMFIEVPSSNYLVTKWLNRYYKLTGSDYVSHISPMHQPYHLYEFLLECFVAHAKINNNLYSIAYYRYEPFTAYMPGWLDKILVWYMKKTNKGMQLCIYLRKN